MSKRTIKPEVFTILTLGDLLRMADMIGDIEIIITPKIPVAFKSSITVKVIEFDPEVVLVDFDYTANTDGTYTLTGWKRTLNGESSTRLIVPDNALIKI